MKTLLAILLAGGGVATTCVAAPSHRGTGAPTADLLICPSAYVHPPQTVGPVDGLIASTGVPNSFGGTCVLVINYSLPPVVPSLSVSVPTPPGVGV